MDVIFKRASLPTTHFPARQQRARVSLHPAMLEQSLNMLVKYHNMFIVEAKVDHLTNSPGE
jgi:hypothetical protein